MSSYLLFLYFHYLPLRVCVIRVNICPYLIYTALIIKVALKRTKKTT